MMVTYPRKYGDLPEISGVRREMGLCALSAGPTVAPTKFMPEKSKCLGIYCVHTCNKLNRYADVGYLSNDLEQFPSSIGLHFGCAQSQAVQHEP